MDRAKISLVVAFSILAARVFAQLPIDGIHYPVGLNGIKAGIPDSPGVYLRDDNLFYVSPAQQSDDYSTFLYVQAPQLMWLTGWKLLGANFGADALVPLIYREADFNLPPTGTTPGGRFPVGGGPTTHSQFGVGDIKIEPLLLAWHWNPVDLLAAAGVWAPSGKFTAGSTDNLGDGEWSPLITLGAVWYPDQAKTWAVSVLNHYECNETQLSIMVQTFPGGGFPPATTYSKILCSDYTLEAAVSKTIFGNTDVGVTSYYQQQFSDNGSATIPYNGSATNPNKDSDVVGAGPEVSVLIPQWDLSVSLRYAYEITSHDRPRGDTVNLSLTKQF